MASLHRYPVKSLLGEDVPALDLDQRGVVGDRTWSVRTADGMLGSGKRTRRFASVPGLLQLRAAQHGDSVVLTMPDGRTVAAQEAGEPVSRLVGRSVVLAQECDVSHFDDGPVSLLGTASVEAVGAELGGELEVARFRPNVVLRTDRAFVEDALVGRRVRLGPAVLDVVLASPRCTMVDAETADLPARPGTLRAVGRAHDGRLGVVAEVVVPGRVRVGDALTVLEDRRRQSS